MGAPQKVTLAAEPWGEELRPLLERVATGKRAEKWLAGIIGALERGDAVALVARAELEPAPLGVLVIAFQKWPLAKLAVLAMATVPGSGFAWGPAFLPHVRELARRAGAEELEAEALSDANRRRLERLGFKPRSSLMVCPC